MIKVDIAGIRFPQICPVCGFSANKYVSISLGKGWNVEPFAVHSFREFPASGSARRSQSGSTIVLRIPVCEKHEFSNEETCRVRLLCIFGGIIVAIIAWIGTGLILKALRQGETAPWWTYLSVAGFIVVLLVSWYTFRPSSLERSFKIIDFDLVVPELIVDLKNVKYRNAFLEENPQAELVKCIERKSTEDEVE